MKAIQVSEFGGPEVLIYKEITEPNPGKGQVKVALEAIGVNPNEAYIRTGNYSFYKPELPFTPGFDGAGTIVELGQDVHHLHVGDRVFVAALLAEKNTGAYAEKMVCDASAVHLLPDSVTYEEGASLGIPALAAYRALFHRAKLKPGEIVLINGASGGVGSLAVQMAKSIGAVVIGTASTDEGKDLVKKAGADFVIDHITEDNEKELLEITNGKGPNVIIEFLANKNLQMDLKVIAYFGRIVVVGNRGDIEITPRLAMIKESDILGMALWNAPGNEYTESLCAIAALIKSGTLVPQVGERLHLSEARKAHEIILSNHKSGKMIMTP